MNTAGMSYSRGPMAIEMGMVTGAVDDLVSGYECLVTALPDVAQRVNDMQNGTEDMAHRLEVFPHFTAVIISHQTNVVSLMRTPPPISCSILGSHEVSDRWL